MKLLFIARHAGYFRNYDSVLRELARRGHHVHLAVEKQDSLGALEVVEALARDCPGISSAMVPEERIDIWSTVSRFLRLGLDYVRYLDPFFDTAPLRRLRAYNRTPRWLTLLADPPLLRGPRWRRVVGRLLHGIDTSVAPPPAMIEFLQREQPDAVLITPFVDLGSLQVDYLRAARMLGIPCGLPIWSWDHLTTKALIRDRPDRVFVWNDIQRREAVDIHGIPADRVVVTGAQCFDHWFARRPSRSREAFCASLRLPADRPLLLYVCSAVIEGSAPEHEFVPEWLEWVRSSPDPRVAGAAVLIRPYPTKLTVWHDVDLSAYGPVAVWGGNPFDEQARSDYFDSLFHSAAVVGLNTSAFLEAGIVGRDVLAILVPRYHDSQEGSPHFNYLMKIGGGLLQVARDREGHLGQIGAAVRRPLAGPHPYRAFVETFIRPGGFDTDATTALAQGIEDLAACTVTVDAASPAAVRRRAALERIVWMSSRLFSPAASEWSRKVGGMERKRRFKEGKERATEARRAERLRAHQARRAEKEQARERRTREKQQLREARLHEQERRQRAERQRAARRRRTELKQLIKKKLGLAS
ncbi:MAG: hypothetical protein FJW14_02590 [Acidimicrobiia bacterium]|nr:hypothetical protein [Acidimicrobiia bacterium]